MNKTLKRYLVAECLYHQAEKSIDEMQDACMAIFTGHDCGARTLQDLGNKNAAEFLDSFDALLNATGLATKLLRRQLELQRAECMLSMLGSCVPEEKRPSIQKNWYYGYHLYESHIWKDKTIGLIAQSKLPDLGAENLNGDDAVKAARLKYAGLERYMDAPGYPSCKNLDQKDAEWMEKARFDLQYFKVGNVIRLEQLWEDERETSKWIIPKRGETAIRRIAKCGRDESVAIIAYEYKLATDVDNYPEFDLIEDLEPWQIDDPVLLNIRVEIVSVGQF